MKWKTAFKEALAFNIVKNFFDAADPGLISEAGMKELRKQNLIKLMKQDQEAGLDDVDFKDKNQITMEKQKESEFEVPTIGGATLGPKYVGMYCLGEKQLCIHFRSKPNWFHRTMMKVCLGWEWTDKK